MTKSNKRIINIHYQCSLLDLTPSVLMLKTIFIYRIWIPNKYMTIWRDLSGDSSIFFFRYRQIFACLEFMRHPKYLTKKNGIAYHFLSCEWNVKIICIRIQLLWSKVKWEIMWKNSLLYVHDPVNQFHSEENDHHCVLKSNLLQNWH